MKKIAAAFNTGLEHAIASGGHEPAIVRNFVNYVASRRHDFGPSVDIQTGFTHSRPYALFRTPARICDAIKCELGDVLLVFKRIVNGNVLDHRATLLQAKKGTRLWSIAPHQLEFLRNVNTCVFEFGKEAVSAVGFQPILFQNLNWPVTWAHYLCLDDPDPSLVYDTDPVYKKRGALCQSFSFRDDDCARVGKLACVNCDGFSAFIHKFTQPAGSGLDIRTDTFGLKMVTIVCKRVGLDVDPEEEWSDYFFPPEDKRSKFGKEDGEGFGVILITANGYPEEKG